MFDCKAWNFRHTINAPEFAKLCQHDLPEPLPLEKGVQTNACIPNKAAAEHLQGHIMG